MDFKNFNLKKYSECHFRNVNSQKIGLFIKGRNNIYPATAHIRLLSIFNSISNDNLYFPCIIDEDEWTIVQNDIANDNFLLDVVVIQRDVLDNTFSKSLIGYCKKFNIKIVYEIDDDLMNISESHPEFDFYMEKSKIIKFIVKNADKVVVSTENLKNQLIHWNNNVVVIQNTLIDFWSSPVEKVNKEKNVIKIGYMGTATHEKDLNLVKDIFINVKNFFSKDGVEIIFEIIGGTDKDLDGVNKIIVPNDKKEYPFFVDWLKRIVNWDVAIAPLEDNNINNSKSEIKYLEYTALGVPCIFSPVGPYKKHIIHNKTGILVKENSSKYWESCLIDLIKNKSLRDTILKNSKKDIEKNYLMNIAVNSWKDILNQLHRNPKSIVNIKIKEYFDSANNVSFIDFIESNSYDIIVESGLFDENWYFSEYEDVKINKLDPIKHYLEMGVYEGCKPNLEFDLNFNPNFSLNPFVYFILYNDVEIKNHILENNMKQTPCRTKANFNKYLLDNFTVTDMIKSVNSISIIIPIYNAYEDTKKCLESVLTNTSIHYNLILINDNSSDERIKPLLKKYSNLNNVTVINNSVNNGFTKNVNLGIKISGNDDVVLLNSDTIVSQNWLQKILFVAYSNKQIGTVTPFSNASDISIPVLWEDNSPSTEDVNKLSLMLGNLFSNYELVSPTGNGYCLFIKRDTLCDVGLFDEESFDQGYGEESDFTMRAKNRGWLNCRVPSIFIYHKKSASFSLEKADLLKKEHKKIILDKHPTIFKEWDKFYHSKNLEDVLDIISFSVENTDENLFKKSAIFITTLKDNRPFIEDLDKFKCNFNLLFVTYSNHVISLWAEDNGQFSIIDQITFNPDFDCGLFNQFYINLFTHFNIYDIFMHQSIVISDLPDFLKIFPLVLFDNLGLSLHYIRPKPLNNYENFDYSCNTYTSKLNFENKKCVVYTAITGGYDNLIDPEFIDPDFDYVCFTDNPELKSNIWDIRLIDSKETNLIRKAREYKILPHKYLSEYDYSFWVDGGFKIVGDLKKYVYTYLKDSSLLAVKHIRRNCIYEESKACIRSKKDDEKVISNQMERYSELMFPKNEGLIESGFLFRKHNDKKLIKVMDDWYDEVKQHSFRDQLSFNYVCWKNKFHYDESDIIIWKNQFIEHSMKHNK